MEIREILNLALIKEQSSIELYTDLLETYRKFGEPEKGIDDLFLYLIKEKTQHKQAIEEKIRNLSLPAQVNPV